MGCDDGCLAAMPVPSEKNAGGEYQSERGRRCGSSGHGNDGDRASVWFGCLLREGARRPGTKQPFACGALLSGRLSIRGGVLDGGVHLGAEDQGDTGDVKPQQHDNHAADRAIGGVVVRESRHIYLEGERGEQPEDGPDEGAR